MELNEFKKAWQSATSENKVREKELDATRINELLRRRGTGILSRLDRSVKIGIWFLVIFFLITLADQLLPSELLFPERWKDTVKVPGWINLLEWFVNLILMLSILIFIVRYRRLQVHSLANQDLKSAITKVLSLMDTFKKEFYLAVFILISAIGLSFLSGAQQGFATLKLNETPSSYTIAVVAGSMIILLGLLIGSIFYIFHKGFNLLFGKYRDQLMKSLNELQENED